MSTTAAVQFANAAWIHLNPATVLLAQDTDYTAFCRAVSALGGTLLPSLYDPSPLTASQIAALAPMGLATGATMLTLATAAAALNPLLGP